MTTLLKALKYGDQKKNGKFQEYWSGIVFCSSAACVDCCDSVKEHFFHVFDYVVGAVGCETCGCSEDFIQRGESEGID